MPSNEDLRDQTIKDKEEADGLIAALEKALAEERAKLTSEKAQLEKALAEERAKLTSEKAELENALAEEKAKLASERAAYPDLCMAAVEQFKGSVDFQMAIDAAVASSLARKDSGRAWPFVVAAGGRSKEEVIQSFQRSDFYKHEMAEFWDSGWKTFTQKAEELFPDVDFSRVEIGEDDIAQSPLDKVIEEEDLASTEEE
ncbi:hypothetical protein CsSME_00035352 [Camellia sinensis var. sinensis]